uniref:N-acetyltransferase domain-containing protein n=1 Tax=Oryza glumipatula TaxID=40148 RepID=A0A0D9Z5G0_9ORYZ
MTKPPSPPPQQTAATTARGFEVTCVKDLLPLLQGVPVTYRFEKHNAKLEGTVAAGGYACACPAYAGCDYRGKVLSALQFEKHAGVTSKNQNGHIFLRNGRSLYELFHKLREVPAEKFPEAFRMAAGVPMTVLAAAAAAAAEEAPRERGLGPGPVAAEQPPASATPRPRPTMEMLTEEEKAGLSLLGLRASGSRTEINSMDGIEGLATEAIGNAPSSDHAMLDAEEMGNAAAQRPRNSGLSTTATVKVPVTARNNHAMPDANEVRNADGGRSATLAVKLEVTSGSDHAMSDVKELKNADYEQPRDSVLATTSAVKVRIGAANDHAMPDAEQTRNPVLEQPWDSSMLITAPVKVRVTETKYRPESILKDVRGLLSTGLLEGFRVTYKKNEVERIGRINGQGYSCGCSECGYRNIMNACEFEQHSGESSNNQNNHIFLDSGISLYMVIQGLKYTKLDMLGDVIGKVISLPPNMIQYEKWKASFQLEKDYFDDAPSDPCSTQSSQESNIALTDSLKDSTSNASSILNWNSFRRRSDRQFKRGGTETSTPILSRSPEKEISDLSTSTSMKSEETPSENTAGLLTTDVTVIQDPPPDHNVDSNSKDLGQPKVRDNTLHPMLFKEGGLPDYTLLTYKLKNGEYTPSQFEKHVGMGRRRQPYRSIYTSDGLTLHELALKLQDGLSSNVNIDELPTLTSGSGKEYSTTSRPIIVPLKRTLQERVLTVESCYMCRKPRTVLGVISVDMIVFCNQCERALHVKCYNNGLQKPKAPLKVLGEYTQFNFMCCEKCQLLRASLHEGLKKREDIAFLRRIRYNICWQLLNGTNMRSDVQHQVIEIFKDAFAETAPQDIDDIRNMVNSKDTTGEKDFRGIYCAVLTTSTFVVSAAILKVRTEEVAELVLIATHNECRKKGYFSLLLSLIEAHLKAWNVRLLTAPVDPEMAPIWSEKLGYTILSDEQKHSMLMAHPLVMFANLSLVQKSLA